MSDYVRYLFFVVVLWVSPSVAEAGAWNQPQGAFYSKAFSSLYQTDSHMIATPTGVQYIDGTYLGWSTGVYGEFGVHDRLTVLATIPYTYALNYDESGTTYTNQGFTDIEIGLQTPVLQNFPLVFRGTVKIPAYSNQDIIPGGEAIDAPFLGDGQVDLTGWLSVGHSLWPKAYYGFAELGFRYRTEAGPGIIPGQSFDNAAVFNLHGGYASNNWRLNLQGQGQLPITSDGGGNKRWVSLSASLGRQLKGPWWASIDAEQELWTRLDSAVAPIGQRLGISVSFEGGK